VHELEEAAVGLAAGAQHDLRAAAHGCLGARFDEAEQRLLDRLGVKVCAIVLIARRAERRLRPRDQLDCAFAQRSQRRVRFGFRGLWGLM
jgi:hypothetical protein